jgi:hypothetical protein
MDFGKLFQSAEDAVYEVMIWILLLPKTLFRSMFSPRLAMKYVNDEWEKKPDDRFDEYLSPVLLWFITLIAPLTFAVTLGDPDNPKFDDRLIQVTLYSMLVPFIYIAWIEMMNKEPVKRSTLKRVFYKHCYAITPGLLLTIVCAIVPVFIVALFPLFFVALIALPIYEAFLIEAELGVSYKKAFFHALGPQVILVIILTIVLSLGWA